MITADVLICRDRLIKEGICDKTTVPSVSAISRLLRGRDEDEVKKSSECLTCILCFAFYDLYFLFFFPIFHFAFCILLFAFYILHFAFCILNFGFWILNFEFYILHFEGHGVNPSECQSGPSDLSQSPSYPLCSQNGLNFSHRGGDGAPSLLNFATISSILFRPPVNPTLAEAFVQSPVFQSFEEKCGKMRSQLKMSSVNNIIAELCYKERSSSIVTSRDYL